MAITLTNIIPNFMSGEIERDSEPDITVNPANPLEIAASAFGPFSGPDPSHIFVSNDGGVTWAQNFILPGGSKTGDTSMRFGGHSDVLYIGILRTDNTHMNILRTNNYLGPGSVVDTLIDRDNEDQPFVQATTAMGGGSANKDKLFVGHNDFNPGSQTASVDLSQDSATAAPPAGMSTARLEVRATGGQDGPSVRPAIHLDGTVYAAYFGWRTISSPNVSDIVVVRDDNWASGVTPFRDLLDSGDGLAGQIVAAGVSIVALSTTLGTQRIGSQMSIAVDPRDSQTVYLAWCDGASAAAYTIHVRRSTDGGQTWSADLRTITGATNCALAINSHGKVGFLYQQLGNPGTGNRWRTHFEMSSDGFATAPTDMLLADVPDQNGAYAGSNPIGDYANVVAIGKDFYGIFSANNTPDTANFPNGVTYLRNANFVTNQLLNTDGVTPVNASIDPFVFHWNEVTPDKDFYLRDWTTNASDHDTGQEPSTYPWFYQKSDVWNRNSNTPGSPVDDWYQGDDPTAGTGSLGDNYAFARISRNDATTAGNVDVEFLSSDYGLGIPYASIGSQNISFAIGDSSKLTAGQLWNLDPTASTHACLAAELNTADDPLVLPSLSGRVPGWPYPDLQVINDNNKAQRNLHINHVAADMDGITIMRIRNAAQYIRDIRIDYNIPPIKWPIPRSIVEVPGSESKVFRPGSSIVLKNMKPGENRWLAFSFSGVKSKPGFEMPVQFAEMVGNKAVNGCTALLKHSTADEIIKSALGLMLSLFKRFRALRMKTDAEAMKLVTSVLKKREVKKLYLRNSAVFHSAAADIVNQILGAKKNLKSFSFDKELKVISSGATTANLTKVLSALIILLKKADSTLTMLLLSEGDPGAVLTTVDWQIALYSGNRQLSGLGTTDSMLKRARKFAAMYPAKKNGIAEYPDLLKDSMPCFKETVKAFKNDSLEDAMEKIEGSFGSARRLQKAHHDFLLKLYLLLNKQQG